jgi:hypothetical protein
MVFHATSDMASSFNGIARTAQQIEEEPLNARKHEWPSEVFDHIEWRCFEAFCEELDRQAGVKFDSKSHEPGGGVDIWLYFQNATKLMIVQCKYWPRKVDIDEDRAFYGVLKLQDLECGIFARH